MHYKKTIYNLYIKRFMDFLLASIALIILCPIVLFIAVAVKIFLGSPVLFKQERPGLHEKKITIYKFRTMTNKRDDKGKLLPDSERLTKFGKLLRTTSLDELPELINIVKGDMSIVGPRPLLVEYLPYYSKQERKRHSIRPGLTGLAQISGRNFVSWKERLEKDIEYVEKVNILLDIKIILLTIIKVLKRENLAVDTNCVEPNFAEERRTDKR